MAKLKMTVTRPSASVEWYKVPPDEITYVNSKYLGLNATLNRFNPDGGLFDSVEVRTRVGNLLQCQDFYNELNNPSSILYRRKNYYEANGCTVVYQLLDEY